MTETREEQNGGAARSTVNTQIIDSVDEASRMTIGRSRAVKSGSDKAYQSVAQSTAMAVQDAADHLRNIMTISTTAMGVALEHVLSTGNDPKPVVHTPGGTDGSGSGANGSGETPTPPKPPVDPPGVYTGAVETASEIVNQAAIQFAVVGWAASHVLENYPPSHHSKKVAD